MHKYILNENLQLLFITILSVTYYYYSIYYPNPIFNTLTIVFFILTLFVFLRNFSFFWLNVFYIFASISYLLSLYFVDAGIYLSEIQTYANFTGAGASITLLTMFFLSTTFYISKGLQNNKIFFKINLETNIMKVLIFFSFVMLLYMLLILLVYGSPLMLGIDRFNYWQNIAPIGYRHMHSLIPQFSFLISFAYITNMLEKKTAIIWFALSLVILILGGEKFSGLVAILFFAMLPIVILKNIQLSFKGIIYAILFVSILVLLVFYNYYQIYGESFLLKFENRLILQGQMNWAIHEMSTFNIISINDIYKSFFGFNAEIGERGIYMLMYLVAPEATVSMYQNDGVTFTAPFPANIEYFWGKLFAPIIIFFISALAALFLGLLYSAIKARAFIISIVLLKVNLYIYLSIMMGELYMLFNIKFFVYIFLIMFYVIATTAIHKNTLYMKVHSYGK